MSTGLSAMNKALNRIPKRAEQRQSERLRDTFVDSGIATAIETIDHQVIFGRRGTGKTHAFRYLEAEEAGKHDVAAYVDLRTVGSPEGLFLGEQVPVTERAGRILVDLLYQVHEALMAAALDDDALLADTVFVTRLDALLAAITSIKIAGETETENQQETKDTDKGAVSATATLGLKPGLSLRVGGESSQDRRDFLRETRRGVEQLSLNFGDIVRALRDLADSLSSTRVWLLLDEWSSVPPEVQPLPWGVFDALRAPAPEVHREDCCHRAAVKLPYPS